MALLLHGRHQDYWPGTESSSNKPEDLTKAQSPFNFRLGLVFSNTELGIFIKRFSMLSRRLVEGASKKLIRRNNNVIFHILLFNFRYLGRIRLDWILLLGRLDFLRCHCCLWFRYLTATPLDLFILMIYSILRFN